MNDIKDKISVVMPAYNEASHISASIEETVRTLGAFDWNWELVVMDDGSSDGTYQRAVQLVPKYGQRLIVRQTPFNMGKGRAIKKSLHYLSGTYVVFLDADLDLHPIQIRTLFDIMELDEADVVIGSKLHPNSVVNYPFQRRIMSLIYYWLVKLLFNLPCHDTQTGLKLFKTEVLRKVFPRILVKKFAFDLEVLVNAHHLGYKITEAPIVLNTKRQYGRIGWLAIYTIIMDTFAIFYRMRIVKYYDRIDYHRRKNLAK